MFGKHLCAGSSKRKSRPWRQLLEWLSGRADSADDHELELTSVERRRGWLVDYSVARGRAIEWLGDRYLLARPIHGGVRLIGPNDLRNPWER